MRATFGVLLHLAIGRLLFCFPSGLVVLPAGLNSRRRSTPFEVCPPPTSDVITATSLLDLTPHAVTVYASGAKWPHRPRDSFTRHLICHLWAIHLTGVGRRLGQWNVPMPAYPLP